MSRRKKSISGRPTRKQIAFAKKVMNDIHEGIDCGETRAQLREVIDTWGWLYDDLDNTKHHKSHAELLLRLEQVLDPKSAKTKQHAIRRKA